ncbi:cadherin-related family member 5-like [Megalops cyprinoides]|uniref:cadherin-related family member 5-like n=1 Tax=Megalops cyprinoides TaxID=118141 RepID=UPI00186440F7|nr:cadherin-related family member 5-like [Megalops cyprinoides]
MPRLCGPETRAMELKCTRFSLSSVYCLLLMFLLLKPSLGQQLCSVPPDPVTIKENHTIDIPLITINIIEGVTLTLLDNPDNLFGLQGNRVMLMKVLDFETLPSELTFRVQCDKANFPSAELLVSILVENMNDNPPVFAQSQYTLNVDELTPEDTSIGRIEANDRDAGLLYYHLEPSTDGYFKIQTVNNPNILVDKVFDYDIIQTLTLLLYAQDTPTLTQAGEASHTATTTITVNIRDIDNRPPWFQPCTETVVGTAKICLSSGYKGRVNLTEKEEGDLPLDPGPLLAIDGDKDRDEPISYKILSGNEAGIFHINENTGDITMLKAADVAGPITLTVLASQFTNNDQFAITSVTFEVMKKSRRFPKFGKECYQGYISCDSPVGSLVLDDKFSNRPLRVWAKDEDFADGVNPDLIYGVVDSTDFTLTAEGFLLLNAEVAQGTVTLQIRAIDVPNDEWGNAKLVVQVLPKGWLSGRYRAEDMAVLGATLAAVLILCLVIIGLLIFHMKKSNGDWQKLSEASTFRGSESTEAKEEMHYTNDGFQNEGDTSSTRPQPTEEMDLRLDTEQEPQAGGTPPEKPTPQASAIPHAASIAPETSSLTGSDKTDSERAVKPILTKERRNEEGGKSVWFKEDVDPSAKDEVVIIPDHEDEEEYLDGEDGDDSSPLASPKVYFADSKTTDKAAVRFQDPAKNGISESEGRAV